MIVVIVKLLSNNTSILPSVFQDHRLNLSGLCSGDRVIEVDGVNIERETHSQVVARIRAGGDRTSLLEVDKELDA